MPSKAFAYLSYGRPAVASGDGVVADLLATPGAGVAVPPETPQALADMIQRLYEDWDLQTHRGKRGDGSSINEPLSWGAQRACRVEALESVRTPSHG